MTTYDATAVSNIAIAHKKGISLQTIRALRDNTLAIAEGDPSAPANLMQTILLGTLTTTSGATQTLSGLVLTPYRSLRIVVKNVSSTVAAATLNVGGVLIGTALAAQADTWIGIINVDLGSSVVSSGIVTNASASLPGVSTITSATTSLAFSLAGGAGTFDAGSILIYGEK